jgi:hypothetical protein
MSELCDIYIVSSFAGPDQVTEKLDALLAEIPEWITQFQIETQAYIKISSDLKLLVDVKIKLLQAYKDLLG